MRGQARSPRRHDSQQGDHLTERQFHHARSGSFVRVNAWRDLAEHVAESLGKGDRVMVAGTLRQRDYETKEGEKRTVWEVQAAEVGAALRYATVKVSKIRRDHVPAPEDPWADQAPAPESPAGGFADEPPF
jgi:single-strand DNA-binding protein